MRFLIGRYHEIALKGRNQWRFINQLKQNLVQTFSDFRLAGVRSIGPRLMVELPEAIADAIAIERTRWIPGIQNFSIAYSTSKDLDAIKAEAIARARGLSAQTFRVSARREDKRFPMTSPEIEREVGAAVVEALGLTVNLRSPELTISIEIMPNAAFVAAGKITGAGGLPVGTTGRGLAMLSGGIDSPVAAQMMMKRGLRLDYIHFHGQPLVSAASMEKASELADHLARYQGGCALVAIPFGILQREIVAAVPRPLRVVLYRRFMMRIATAIAERAGCTTIVTGESLGQVASQTLENMTVIENAAGFPVMRPLVGMDKNEIVERARAIGTFETSILPDQDCCTLFVPVHPETRARLADVEAAETNLNVARMVADAVANSSVSRHPFPPPNSHDDKAQTAQSESR
jgi:thiamine biosynthesis protein ThiI